jgi:hypothetical protein
MELFLASYKWSRMPNQKKLKGESSRRHLTGDGGTFTGTRKAARVSTG